MKTLLSLLALITLSSQTVHARPEYATKTQQSCSSCHASPWGGGPRNLYGKIYGARSLGNPITNNSDLYYGDLRSALFFPKKPVESSSGMVIMEAAASANVPVLEKEDGSGMHVVATYNFSPLASNAREAYVHWKVGPDESELVSHLVIGRFNAPFGLLTDEHRTYTRQLTNSTLNDFDTGIAVSGEPIHTLHYDLALVNNLQGTSSFNNQDSIWGEVFNLRWMPSFVPLMFGASQNFQHSLNQNQPWALSFYSVLSMDRLTSSKVNGSISAEVVTGQNWANVKNNSADTPNLNSFFIPTNDTDFTNALTDSHSLAYYVLAKYELSPRWSLFYKYDYLVFDEGFHGDGFARHGLGFEVFINSNVTFNARVEKAFVGRPEISGTQTLSAQDDVIAMLRLWI